MRVYWETCIYADNMAVESVKVVKLTVLFLCNIIGKALYMTNQRLNKQSSVSRRLYIFVRCSNRVYIYALKCMRG